MDEFWESFFSVLFGLLIIAFGIFGICFLFIYIYNYQKDLLTIEEKLMKIGFKVDRKLDCKNVGAGLGTDKIFCVDDKNKKIAIVPFQCSLSKNDIDIKSLDIFKFSEVIDFELKEDGDSIVSGKTLATFAGAVVAGIPGAIIGSSKKGSIKNTCNNLAVYLYLNNIQKTKLVIPFINNENIKKKSTEYRNYFGNATELISILKYIKNNS